MNNIARQTNQLPEVRHKIEAMAGQFAAVLPKHITPAKFVRTVITAIQNDPGLLDCDRHSLFKACMRAAEDGVLPDGRHGVIVPFKRVATWMLMIAGLRELVRRSGEVVDWNAHVVRERDHWDYQEGENAHIYHKPVRGDRGEVVAAYSIARLRGGEVSREWMWKEELDKVRGVSRANQTGPWAQWTDEMYRKTVARRHSKILPMATDLEGVFEREDKDDPQPSTLKSDDNSRIATMVEALDRISGKAPEKKAADDGVDADTGEVIDQGEYAPSDDEQLPLKDQRHAAKTG